MWEQYRKTLIPLQAIILIACGWLYLTGQAPLMGVLVIFLVMQLGAVLGAMWAARIKHRIERNRDRLPLDKS